MVIMYGIKYNRRCKVLYRDKIATFDNEQMAIDFESKCRLKKYSGTDRFFLYKYDSPYRKKSVLFDYNFAEIENQEPLIIIPHNPEDITGDTI